MSLNHEAKEEIQLEDTGGKEERKDHLKQKKEQEKHAHKDWGKEVEKLTKENQDLQMKAAELQDALLRKTADFDNYRKRVIREKEEFQKTANKDLILEILPIVDDFERGLKAAEETKNFDALVEGIKMVHSRIHNLFTEYHVKIIDAKGVEFDHNLHQALNYMETDDARLHNKVAEVFETGYIMGDLVIRPSKVIVWRKKEQKTETAENQ